MAKKTKEVTVDEAIDEIVKEDATEATVTWNGGVRVYSLAVHGEDFRDLAEEFAGKRGGVVA